MLKRLLQYLKTIYFQFIFIYQFKDIVSNSHENVFLSIDIEGSEYDILQHLHELTDNLVGLNIEFHNVDKNLDKIEKFIKKSNEQLEMFSV